MDGIRPQPWTLSGIMSRLNLSIRHISIDLPQSPSNRPDKMGALRIRIQPFLIPQRSRFKSLQAARRGSNVTAFETPLQLQSAYARSAFFTRKRRSTIQQPSARPTAPPATSSICSRAPRQTKNTHRLIIRKRTPIIKLHIHHEPPRRP